MIRARVTQVRLRESAFAGTMHRGHSEILSIDLSRPEWKGWDLELVGDAFVLATGPDGRRMLVPTSNVRSMWVDSVEVVVDSAQPANAEEPRMKRKK